MGSSVERPLRVRIAGDLELDEQKRELRDAGGARLAIQPKVFDVLVYLVRGRERVVSREELQRAVWGSISVAPDSITRALREVRRLLGARREVVRTYPSRGVRFVAAVEELLVDRASSLVGIGSVLAAIDAVLAADASARGSVRVILGAPGTGKSSVLAHASERASRAGIAVQRASSLTELASLATAAASSRIRTLLLADDLDGGSAAREEVRRLERAVTSGPVTILATCCLTSRDEPSIASVLAIATRNDPHAVLRLPRLDASALAQLAVQELGRSVSPAAIGKLAALTGGNPRFARHVLHLAREARRPLETLDELPAAFGDRLRELVLAHVDIVGAEVKALLEAVSILDAPFTLDLAREVAARLPDETADALAAAMQAGLLVEEPAGRWQFAHGLLRTVLERGLSPSRRAQFHARAAVALERWLSTSPAELDRLARHYVAGATVANAERALALVQRTAQVSLEQGAFHTAARRLAQALDVEALLVPAVPARRRAVWLELAKALARDGQLERAGEAFSAAASDLASSRRDGDPTRAAFAAIAPDLARVLERFYDLLFERHPSVRPLFTRSMVIQRRMFGDTIAMLVDHADDPDWLRTHLEALGRRHADYGVTEEMYGWVRASFLDAIVGALPPPRAAVAREHWEATFDSLAHTMIRAQLEHASSGTPTVTKASRVRRSPRSRAPRGRRRASAH